MKRFVRTKRRINMKQSINIQDQILNQLRKDKVYVTVFFTKWFSNTWISESV